MHRIVEGRSAFLRYSTTAARNLAGTEALTTYSLAQRLAKSRVQRARTKLQDMILECCTIERDHRGRIVDHECRRGCGCR